MTAAVLCYTRQPHLRSRFLPNLGTGAPTGIMHTASIDPLFDSSEHSLSTYCTSTRGTCTTVSAVKAVEPRQNAVRSALPRSVQVAEICIPGTSLRICTCVSSSGRNHQILPFLPYVSQFLFRSCCHRVCFITRVLENDILFTSANMLALTPPAMSGLCTLIWISHFTSDNSIPCCRACSSIFDSLSSSSSRRRTMLALTLLLLWSWLCFCLHEFLGPFPGCFSFLFISRLSLSLSFC